MEDFGKFSSREEAIEAIKENGFEIQYVKNPDEELQLMAIEENYFSIRCIPNPTEKVQLKAIENGYWVVKYIAKPCQKVIDAVNGRRPIPRNISPENFKYKFYEQVFTTMEEIKNEFDAYIIESDTFFRFKTLGLAINYFNRVRKDKDYIRFGKGASEIEIRKIDFNKLELERVDQICQYMDYVGRTEFNHGEEIDMWFLLPCLFGADDCQDGNADYLVFEYKDELYMITILCYE